MSSGEVNKKMVDARLAYVLAAALLVVGIVAVTSRFNAKTDLKAAHEAENANDKLVSAQAADDAQPKLMFVQAADDMRADEKGHTLRLVNAGQQTLYFSDRPVRIAGHIKMANYLDEWNHGKDSFAKDNPNATLSVFEPGRPDNTLVVVEISHPVVDGKDIVYTYKLLDGTMPANGGASTIFIDWAAARPGAGAGGYGAAGSGAGGAGHAGAGAGGAGAAGSGAGAYPGAGAGGAGAAGSGAGARPGTGAGAPGAGGAKGVGW